MPVHRDTGGLLLDGASDDRGALFEIRLQLVDAVLNIHVCVLCLCGCIVSPDNFLYGSTNVRSRRANCCERGPGEARGKAS